MMNKKAVSTIVVTVLLVTFVIALGVIINTWMRATVQSYVDEGEKDIGAGISCLNVKMQLEKKDTPTIKIYIKNNGEIELSGFTAVKYDVKDISTVDNSQKTKQIPSYGVEQYSISLQDKKVKIIPFITTEQGIVSECTEQAITLTL